ncbi:MAG: penicillin-binding protein, partial [Flavobacteriaceae bacterium]|nr:penicillin-binding protein [Flavobacteriaceae bacterium]
MPIKDKSIILRIYLLFGLCFIIGIGIMLQLFNIQISYGEYYRERALKNAYREFVIEADRGNIYDANQDLLAISVPKFDIRFDALTIEKDTFETYVRPLAKSLSGYFQKPESYYTNLLRSARAKKNRYLLIAKDLDYYDLQQIKSFPLSKKGPYRGGIIVEQNTKREYPMGKVAERTVGYDRADAKAGLEGEFTHYLKGKN